MIETAELIVILVAFVIALCEVAKKLGIANKYIPFVSLVLGLALSLLFVDGDLKVSIFYGLAIGLAAGGSFDLSKLTSKLTKELFTKE